MNLLERFVADGRTTVRLGDVYEVTRKPRGLVLPDVVPFAAMEDLPLGGEYSARFVDKPKQDLTSGTYFERGDILIAKITPSFENGKQALTQNLPTPFGYATTEVIPLRPIDRTRDSRFLFFYLLHPDVRSYVAERMEGATGRQRVPDSVLLDLPVPKFSPDEETHISDALEHIQRGRFVEERAARLSQALKQAAMRELFTRGLRQEVPQDSEVGLIPQSWGLVRLGDLGRIGNGSTPKRANPAYWTGGSYPWLTSAKVYDRDICVADQFVTETALDECHLPRLKPGAVLIAITGQGKTLGHCAVLGIEATISQHLAYLDTDQERVLPSFVRGYLETQYEYLRQVASGGGSTKSALTCAFLRELKIPVPSIDDPARSLEEQRHIVSILDAIDRKLSIHQKKKTTLEELFNSLLHNLMTGEVRVSDLNLSALAPANAEVPA